MPQQGVYVNIFLHQDVDADLIQMLALYSICHQHGLLWHLFWNGLLNRTTLHNSLTEASHHH